MPIDEVGEGSGGVYGSLLFDENEKGNGLQRFSPYWVGATRGRQHGAKQRAELRVTC